MEKSCSRKMSAGFKPCSKSCRLPRAVGVFAPMLFSLILWGLSAFAQGPPSAPILRVETGTHLAVVPKFDIDAAEKHIVTASWDKTVRVWDANKRGLHYLFILRQTMRVPIGHGNDGELYAVAISPDGSLVATGGWTGYSWTKTSDIYVFDRSSGGMLHRIQGLAGRIYDLTFSEDGRFLAACFGGDGQGVRIYSAKDWSLRGEDLDYGNKSFGADFDCKGRLATSCSDGYIRLYDNNFSLVAKTKAPGGNRPYGLAFSPDGGKIAVGFNDSSVVNVLSGKDLSFLYSPDSENVEYGRFWTVSWSPDGERLYAGGSFRDGDGDFIVRCWDRQGAGTYEDKSAVPHTIRHLAALKGGGFAISLSNGAWLRYFDESANRKRIAWPAKADFQYSYDNLFLSESGNEVGFGYEQYGDDPARFSISGRALRANDEPEGLYPPMGEGLPITDWRYQYEPKLNGKNLEMEEFEVSRCRSICADRQSFVLGSTRYIKRYDRNGSLLWKTPVNAAADAINVTRDGAKAVAALGDGTIRWYRLSDGKELLALFPHYDQKRWVIWTPSGYYDASPGADELIGWHVNRGRDRAPDFFPASKFRSVYNRHDVIRKVLAVLDEGKAVRLADKESGRRSRPVDLDKMYPPVVSILSPRDGHAANDTQIVVRYAIRNPSGEPVTAVDATIDGARTRSIERISGRDEIKVTIPPRDCEIAIIAKNRFSASDPALLRIRWKGGKKADSLAPALYVLSLGVGDYDKHELRLKYPAKDAEDFARIMASQKGRLYRDVKTKLYGNASKNEVLEGLQWLRKNATDRDVTAVFIAGHGVNDSYGKYVFLPKEGDPDNLLITGVQYDILRDAIANLPGKRLLFIDTCYSANIMGSASAGGMADVNKLVNDLAASENGVVVFSSSTGNQLSMESDRWNNGAFTKALVEGLTGKSGYINPDGGKITVMGLGFHIARRVEELTEKRQTPAFRIPGVVTDFPVARLK